MYIITKRFRFEAAHQLTKVPEGHKCGRLHGHSYVVEFGLRSSELDEMGFVRDYGEISENVKPIIEKYFDHRNLNESLPSLAFLNDHPMAQAHIETTAENIARFLFEFFQASIPELCSVSVEETDGTSATYIPETEISWGPIEGANEIALLMHDRNEMYGDAWLVTGRWIHEHTDELNRVGDIAFCIILVHNKLTRALKSPYFVDHYNDAQGYLRLAQSARPDLNITLNALSMQVGFAAAGDQSMIELARTTLTDNLKHMAAKE
jgi:6-pyruvoyltetrahydropterin/6-carboxytetrahydropterin synthase